MDVTLDNDAWSTIRGSFSRDQRNIAIFLLVLTLLPYFDRVVAFFHPGEVVAQNEKDHVTVKIAAPVKGEVLSSRLVMVLASVEGIEGDAKGLMGYVLVDAGGGKCIVESLPIYGRKKKHTLASYVTIPEKVWTTGRFHIHVILAHRINKRFIGRCGIIEFEEDLETEVLDMDTVESLRVGPVAADRAGLYHATGFELYRIGGAPGSGTGPGTKELFLTGRSSRVRAGLRSRCLIRLDALDQAEALAWLSELNIPGFNFHGLHRMPKRCSNHVNGPWCITFGWVEGAIQGQLYRVSARFRANR